MSESVTCVLCDLPARPIGQGVYRCTNPGCAAVFELDDEDETTWDPSARHRNRLREGDE